MSTPFSYPATPHVRKHGPAGYREWENYRPWLRDEFDFRCVYCLCREKWGRRRGSWVVEHLVPREKARHLALEYSNLVYACSSCNSAKSAKSVPDPCRHAYGQLVYVTKDGKIHAKNADGHKLIQFLALDEEDLTTYREMWLHILQSWKKYEPERYRQCMSFPDDLPDLTQKIPPNNTKPEGANNCRYQQREQNKLPEIYG
jgi:hypothetical protein